MATNQKNSILQNLSESDKRGKSKQQQQTLEIADNNKKMTNIVKSTQLITPPTTVQNELPSMPSSPMQNQIIKIPVSTASGGEHQHQTNKQHQQQQQQVPTGGIANPHIKVKARKETLEAKRERKAAKTLAIITGAFVVCWLPFFLMALILPLCGETCTINDKVAALFLWLGYFNSTLNPVIYTIFSPEFRQAFKRILFGTHRTGYYRGGKL